MATNLKMTTEHASSVTRLAHPDGPSGGGKDEDEEFLRLAALVAIAERGGGKGSGGKDAAVVDDVVENGDVVEDVAVDSAPTKREDIFADLLESTNQVDRGS